MAHVTKNEEKPGWDGIFDRLQFALSILGLLAISIQLLGEDLLTSTPPWVMATVALAALGGTTGLLYATRSRGKPSVAIDPGEQLRRRIKAVDEAFKQANVAFIEAGNLADELRRELAAQQAAHQQLTEEAERQRVLINMDRQEAEAVQALILGNTEADRRRQRIREWTFFLAGLLLAIPLNIVSDLIGPK